MSKREKPRDRAVLTTQVTRTKQISPNVIRVTAAGGTLGGLHPMGFDQWFRMFMRLPGQTELGLPTATGNLWYAQYRLMSKETRPLVRNYTIREYRASGPDGPEIDIDFVVHEGGTPASTWVTNVDVGEKFGIIDEGWIYEPNVKADWRLLVGDETALPAIAGILESSPADLRAEVFIELPHADDAQPMRELPGVNVHWVPRANAHDRSGPLVQQAVTKASLPADGVGYAFLAGESAMATGLRSHLLADRGFSKSHVSFTGYWRFGKSAG